MAINDPLTVVVMANNNYPNGEGGYGSSQSESGYGSKIILQFGVSSSSEERTLGYRYTESVIPVGRRVFVMGSCER